MSSKHWASLDTDRKADSLSLIYCHADNWSSIEESQDDFIEKYAKQ